MKYLFATLSLNDAQHNNTEWCHYAECCYTDSHTSFFDILNFVMLNVAMLCVIMLSVVAPL